MDITEIKGKLDTYRQQGKRLFSTSSFQTHSVVLLHIISRVDKSIPIYFLNTGYHFPESIMYKDQIAETFGLNVINTFSSTPRHMQRDAGGNLLFTSNPDFCCYLNKVQPMEPILAQYDIWINGVRADQNANRRNMKEEQGTPQGAMRYHPVLKWTTKMIEEYIKEYKLPPHPLEEKGYFSISCEPCTRKVDLTDNIDIREGRWFGMSKTECGLHTDLIEKQ